MLNGHFCAVKHALTDTPCFPAYFSKLHKLECSTVGAKDHTVLCSDCKAGVHISLAACSWTASSSKGPTERRGGGEGGWGSCRVEGRVYLRVVFAMFNRSCLNFSSFSEWFKASSAKRSLAASHACRYPAHHHHVPLEQTCYVRWKLTCSV